MYVSSVSYNIQACRKVSISSIANTLIGQKYNKNIVQDLLFLNYGLKTGTAEAMAAVPAPTDLI